MGETGDTPATEDILLILEAALVVNAKTGGFGIAEEDLRKCNGLEDLRLPLGEPPEESNVRRMRLPGKGYGSQWTYALKAEKRIQYTADYRCKPNMLLEPL